MMDLMKLSLQQKITAAILSIFLLMAGLFTAIQLPFQHWRMESATANREVLLHTLVERDQQVLAQEIIQNRTSAIRTRIDEISKIHGILATSIFDGKGRLLAPANVSGQNIVIPPEDIPRSSQKDLMRIGRLHNQRAFIYTQEIDAGGKRIGFIQIHYSLADLEREQRQSYFIFGLLVTIFVLLLVLLNSILSRVVIRPILSLKRTMDRINHGTLGSQVEIAGTDEISDLTKAFNRMSTDLASSYRDLQESENSLALERERLYVTLRSIGDGVIATDIRGNIVLMNHSAASLTGFSIQDATGRPLPDVFRIVDEKTGEPVESTASNVLRTNQVAKQLDHTILVARDGTRHCIEDNSTPIISNQGIIIGVILVFKDVTEKHRIDLEMSKIRHFLKNIIDSMPSMLISVNEDGIILEWNEASTRATGLPATEAVGRNVWQLLPYLEKYKGNLNEVMKTGKERIFRREVKGLGDAEEYYNISLFPLILNKAQGIVFRIDDITESEGKEQQLRQAQKMETIGTLAGGLAHDFNNILGGITGSVSLIKFKLNQPESFDRDFLLKYLGIMEEAGNRAADLVKQLLSISSKQELVVEPVDLNSTIEHVMKICTNTFDKSIELSIQLFPNRVFINASPTQMEQVLLNLCVNAAHSMTSMRKENEHQGGKLTVSVKKIFADKSFCSTHAEAREQKYWILSVADTGVGMDTRTVAKIFDPFFTTKLKNKGTGLGLAMVYNIVQQHGGFVDVYTEVNVGSTFNVYLPVFEPDQEDSVVEQNKAILQGEGLILVVDDEDMIRQTARAILEECGYTVLLAENGEEGVNIYRNRHNEIKAVLLDMIMPKMSGKEAFLEMKKIDPGLKVLLASGFKHDERVESILNSGVYGFVQKPYNLQILSEAIFKVVAT